MSVTYTNSGVLVSEFKTLFTSVIFPHRIFRENEIKLTDLSIFFMQFQG